MKTKLIFTVLCFVSLFLGAQKESKQIFGYGAEVIYNMPVQSLGFGLRVHAKINENWFLSPQLSYFPGISNTVELYAGLGINYNLTPKEKWGAYPTVGAFYNRFYNHTDYTNDIAKLNSFAPDLGFGVVKNAGCMRPFAELKLNPVWMESNIRIGAIFYIGECYKKLICPAYTSLW
ncbi:MAG: hypothetical protein RLZZ414_485 [Bacteroidota bacterium]